MRAEFDQATDIVSGAIEDLQLSLEQQVDDILDMLLDSVGDIRKLDEYDMQELVKKVKGLIS